MRIEAYTQAIDLYNTQRAKVNKAKAASPLNVTDQLHISNAGRDLQIAKEAVASAADISPKAEKIKEQIKNGTYSVNENDFASLLADKFYEMR